MSIEAASLSHLSSVRGCIKSGGGGAVVCVSLARVTSPPSCRMNAEFPHRPNATTGSFILCNTPAVGEEGRERVRMTSSGSARR